MAPSALDAKPAANSERAEYYGRIREYGAAPLWEALSGLVTPEPRPVCIPAMWRYRDLRPLLLEAGGLITAREAERRVLVLENPAVPGMSRITDSLYAGLQLVMPGEIAGSHRHVAAALRLTIESEGGYTAVDGEKAVMEPGDFVITPSWTYHDHGNPGASPVIWMDVLDLPLVNFLGCSFAEHHECETQPLTRPEGDSYLRYGANLLPADHTPANGNSPVFRYPYARTRETLEGMKRNGPMHACHGFKLRYVNPATGGPAMTTIGTFVQLLPKGFEGDVCRATDATIFCAVEGTGETSIGDRVFRWEPHDIFVAPSWMPVRHRAESDAVLFSASDRPVQQALGLWREKAGG
ncbi:MAG: gentisate 1,2-dioxygenase [Acidobacteriota bacterium]|nr:gentisate 1,2-dioxygenase [Acidobacteriota bacterium]